MTTLRSTEDDTAGMLVGRTGDLARLTAFLDEAPVGGASLVLSGGPGVGKTALLEWAARQATDDGWLVLRAGGVEFEADVGFSTLNQILLPLQDERLASGPTYRRALEVALGFEDGPRTDLVVVIDAVRSLLARLVAVRPTLLVVDDVQWVDRSSAAVLGFLAADAAVSGWGVLAASRSEEAGFLEPFELPVLDVAPLGPGAAAELLRRRYPSMAAPVARRVLAEASGNPLALVELPAALSDEQRAAHQDLPWVLPLSRRLESLFTPRLVPLPSTTRTLLLLAALAGTGDLRLLRSAAGRPVLRDLAVAERARLVVVDESSGRLAFRHPVVRSTVVSLSTAGERRRAHSRLAAALVHLPDRRVWHLAAASAGTDERIADLLEQFARRALRRGDAVGGVSALHRAAELSPDHVHLSRRLAEAAYVGADITGELHRASRMLLQARRSAPREAASLRSAGAAAYVLLNGDGDIETAHGLLLGALETSSADDEDGDAFLEAVQTLLFICLWGERPGWWASFHAVAARLPPGRSSLLRLQAQLLGDPARASASTLRLLDARVDGLAEEPDLATVGRTAQAGTFVDRLPACREALWRVVRDGRDGGAVALELNALVQLSVDDYLAGRWDDAERLAGEGLDLCTGHGYEMVAWPLRLVKALVAAGRGRYPAATDLADRMSRWAAPRGIGAVAVFGCHTRTMVALGRGDFEDAYHHVTAISPAGTFPENLAHALWVPLDLVEAAVRSHRPQEAAAHVQAMRALGVAAISPRLAFVVAGATALAAPDDDVVERFEEALALPGVERWPFDLARVHLVYGERLRRARAIGPARVHLAAAAQLFRGLGAQPWLHRADHELRATGLATGRTAGTRPGALTPQEHEIALLAASGLTNRQIAQRLLISHRTVGAHLRQVFPKLGVRSRAGLRDALDADGG